MTTCRTDSGALKDWTHTVPEETANTPLGPWEVHDRDCQVIGTIAAAYSGPDERDVYGHPTRGPRRAYEAYAPDGRLVGGRYSVQELVMDLQRAAGAQW